MKFLRSLSVKTDRLKEKGLCPSILNFNLTKYTFGHFFNDIFSGLKIFFMAFPIVISFAIFSGGSPIQGLITVGIATAVSVFLGGSKYQINSIAWVVSLISLDIFTKYQYKGMLLTSFFIALVLVIFGNIRIGELLKYTPKTFLSAIAVCVSLTIIVTQTQVLLNIPITYSYQNFYGNCTALFSALKCIDTSSLYRYLIFMGSFAILRLFFKHFTVYIVYLICWGIIVWCDTWNIFTLPDILSSLKTIGQSFFQDLDRNTVFNISFSFPFSQSVCGSLTLQSFSIAMIVACQCCFCTGMTKSLTGDNGVQTNMELISVGIANFLSVATGGLFVAPDIDLTVKNVQSKSKSTIALITIVVTVGAVLYVKDRTFKYIPSFALSSILIYTALHILRQYFSTKYFNIRTADAKVFWLILVVAIGFGFVFAIFIGFIISLMEFAGRMLDIKETSVGTTKEHNSDVTEFVANKYGYISNKRIPSKILKKTEVIQFDSILGLNLIKNISDTFISCGKFPDVAIIYFKNVPFFDAYAFNALKDFVKIASERHTTVMITGTNGLLLELLKRKAKEYNSGNVFGYIVPSFSEAVRQTVYRLGPHNVISK